ncbi:MAG: SH3 domain-containing protein [Chloroflexi bacterium]|nr:SH3 domain-containing protein [Chloroflexota bacterium]
MRLVLVGIAIALLTVMSALAQPADQCVSLVQRALSQTDSACEGLGRNQACYGNRLIDVSLKSESADAPFNGPGDVLALFDIDALNLSPMITPDEWGIAVLSLQANLPGSLPGQNVTMVLIGDVVVQNRGADTALPDVSISAQNNVNVRSGPSTGNAVITTLTPGESYVALGRSAAGDWVLVRINDETTGWVALSVTQAEGDPAELPELDPTATVGGSTFGPMQAITLRTGIGRPQCAEAPPDGVLIQTPQGVGRVNLLINEVRVELGSTAFLTAHWGNVMTLSTLEGTARVGVGDRTVNVPAGAQVDIPLNAEGLPSGDPTVAGYDAADFAALAPLLDDVVPESVGVAVGLTEADLLGSIVDRDGQQLCVLGGTVIEHTFPPDEDPNDRSYVTGMTVGGVFEVRGGTTATFTAGGESRLTHSYSDYIRVSQYLSEDFANETPIRLAQSGASQSLTFTFQEDGLYFVNLAGTHDDTVTLTIVCGE